MSPLTEPTRLTLAKSFTWNETVWNPSMIQAALWLDAADASTITESGGAVSQWDDKSGNGRNPAQSTSGSRPTYSATGENGLGAISFNGSSQQLEFPNSAASGYALKFGTSSYEVYAVINPASLSSSTNIFMGARGFQNGWLVGFSYSYPYFRMYNAGEQWAPSPMTSITATTGRQIFGASAPRGATGQYRKNGSLLQSTTTAVGSASMDNTEPVRIGSYSSGGAPFGYFTGSICELILVSTNLLDDANRERMEGYLAHKWGLTANLPAGHPYKTVGPTP